MSHSQSTTDWFKARIDAVYAAKDDAARNDALDVLLAPSAQVHHNTESFAVDQKRSQILSLTAAAAHVGQGTGKRCSPSFARRYESTQLLGEHL